jgi:hypothetical protein
MNDDAGRPVSRRSVLAGAASASAFLVVPRHVLGGPGHTAPSDRINLACVGAGGQAAEDIALLEAAGARIAFGRRREGAGDLREVPPGAPLPRLQGDAR